MSTRVHTSEPLKINEQTVMTILDKEGQQSVREATKLALGTVREESPVGATGVLKKAHRMSVRRTPYGYVGRIRRQKDAWYGRIVERGRKPGRSKRSKSRGRRYPGAKADPFVDRAAASVADEAEQRLDAGAARAADQIARRLGQ